MIRKQIDELGGPLQASFGNHANVWSERAGLLLRLRDRHGLVGLGEASPLPGYSPDTLADCRDALETITLPDDFEPNDVRSIAERVPIDVPAARFAVETALLDLAGKRLGVPASVLLADRERAPIPLNATIASIDDAMAAHRRGIRTFKVKVGTPGRFDDEIGLLRALRDRLGPDIALRADANRAWTVAEAHRALDALAPIGLEYIEEPVHAGACLAHSPIPLAIDESLADADWALGSASVMVLKPMLLGGLFRCWDLARLGVDVVVSHLIDGPVALGACGELALALGAHRACGLDRHVGLTAWPRAHVAGISADHIMPTAAPGIGVAL